MCFLYYLCYLCSSFLYSSCFALCAHYLGRLGPMFAFCTCVFLAAALGLWRTRVFGYIFNMFHNTYSFKCVWLGFNVQYIICVAFVQINEHISMRVYSFQHITKELFLIKSKDFQKLFSIFLFKPKTLNSNCRQRKTFQPWWFYNYNHVLWLFDLSGKHAICCFRGYHPKVFNW